MGVFQRIAASNWPRSRDLGRNQPQASQVVMTHNPRAAANEFIKRGIKDGSPLTHIEVQKLLYFASGWMLGIHGRPLHDGHWEAWQYGPVVRDVYFSLNHYRGAPITAEIPTPSEQFREEETSIIDAVYDYRRLGPSTLIGLSHARGGPWDSVWHGGTGSSEIDNDLIERYFADLARQNGASNE